MLSPARVQHLLWMLYSQITPDPLILAPDHADLTRLTAVVAKDLLRRYKGRYYRPRFATLTIAG